MAFKSSYRCPHCGTKDDFAVHCDSPSCDWITCKSCKSLIDYRRPWHYHPDDVNQQCRGKKGELA